MSATSSGYRKIQARQIISDRFNLIIYCCCYYKWFILISDPENADTVRIQSRLLINLDLYCGLFRGIEVQGKVIALLLTYIPGKAGIACHIGKISSDFSPVNLDI